MRLKCKSYKTHSCTVKCNKNSPSDSLIQQSWPHLGSVLRFPKASFHVTLLKKGHCQSGVWQTEKELGQTRCQVSATRELGKSDSGTMPKGRNETQTWLWKRFLFEAFQVCSTANGCTAEGNVEKKPTPSHTMLWEAVGSAWIITNDWGPTAP